MKQGLGPREGGSTSILAVLLGAGLVLVMTLGDWSRNTMKAKEVGLRAANANAEMANLAAISYVQASLQHKLGATPLLTVSDNQFVGTGNNLLLVEDGKALYKQYPLAEATDTQAAALFTGGTMPTGEAQVTEMEVLETQVVGHTKIYVVKATTVARQGKNSFGKISTLGRMKIAPQELSTSWMLEETDCGVCLVKAAALTLPLGYVADIKRTRNFGFYKVKASTNLCDVHFLKSLSDSIEDHDGTTSVLKTQVAAYCPCDCPWPK